MKPILSIDIETYSDIDLINSGVYHYVDTPEFQILLLAYAYGYGPIQILDLTVEELPGELREDLTNSEVIKAAFNANFERTCLSKYLNTEMPPEEWRCTAVHASALGLPRSLAEVARVIGMPEDKQKMAAGKALIKFFSVPCKPTKKNGFRTKNLSHHDPEKWQVFKEYCGQDVEVERAIRQKLEKFPILESEQKLWALDQEINDRGVKVDRELVDQAMLCDSAYKNILEQEAIKLTGLDNPNSVSQLKKWLEAAEGVEISSLTKATVPELMANTDNDSVRRVLEIRSEMAKTSVSKYLAMDRSMDAEGRIKGMLQFYGANRTGRWAGRLVQVHNLPKNKLIDLALARELLRAGQHDILEMLFGNVPDTLSQLIRTAFIPKEGSRFIVADFSAIEARVIAWIAGEAWRMEVFRTHGKIYEASASQMFKVPLERIKKGNPEYELRSKGKIAELALGYGGSKGALIAMGALDMGVQEEELPRLVTMWRNSNTAITKFWWDIGSAAIKAVRDKTVTETHGIVFKFESGFLFARLPSGRQLAYVRPKIEIDDRYGRDKLTYEGIEQGKKSWGRIDTYGPKLVENIIQALSRDCLAYAMMNVASEGYKIVMHVHDEIIVEAPNGYGSLKDLETIMGRVPPWTPGLPLRADGYECEFYRKE